MFMAALSGVLINEMRTPASRVRGRRKKSLFDDIDRELGAVRLREPGLVFKSRRHGAVADLVRIAELVELEQFRGQRFAAGVALTLLGVDPNFQLSRHRNLPCMSNVRTAAVDPAC